MVAFGNTGRTSKKAGKEADAVITGDTDYNPISKWLYEDDWNEKKLNEFRFWYSVPGVGDYLDYLLDIRADKEYLERYGMDYSDIHDPRKLSGTRSASNLVSTGYRMISRNVDKLYRNTR